MSSLPAERVEPTASPLPPLPQTDPFTPAQWKTLWAIADAVVPSIRPASTAHTSTELAVADNAYSTALSTIQTIALDSNTIDLAKSYLEERPSTLPAFKNNFHRLFGLYIPQDSLKQLTLILNLLDSRAGCLLLTGYATPISAQPIHIREAILKSWGTARLAPLRGLHKSLTALIKQNWVRCSPTLGRVLSFPRVPVHGKPAKGFEYEFIQIPPGEEPEVLETDIVIVGSGCGAGVCAKNLAEDGHRVIVVEKAYHWPAEHLPMSEQEGPIHMFMNGGAILSDDNSTAIAAGQTFGGGGTVNWSASLQTQGYVRAEWAAQGLPFFTSAEFQHSLDRVCDRMGVSADHITHNKTNQVLLDGARQLGWSAKPVPQNTGGAQHYCGYCTLGCGSCEKQGPVVSFLPDATRAGALFIEGLNVEKVLFETVNGSKTATGVRGVWTSRDSNGGVAGLDRTQRPVIINAKRVIVAAGTMSSPLILRRSGLTNPHIGRHLHLHPVCVLGAIYPDDIRPWEGSILTAVVNEFENLDSRGHGAKLEACTMLPGSWLTFPRWTGGLEWKMLAPRMRNMVGHISLARDRDAGSVYEDKEGRTRFQYNPSKFDRKHILEGVVALAKINYIAGATEIFTMIPGVPHFVREPDVRNLSSPSSPSSSASSFTPAPRSSTSDETTSGINDPSFQSWLRLIRATGLRDPDTTFVSAHQMGTCRMGADPGASVVDPRGRVWGTEGLYVADASLFPSASGVNPMVTNMAVADWVSRGVGRGLRRMGGEGVRL